MRRRSPLVSSSFVAVTCALLGGAEASAHSKHHDGGDVESRARARVEAHALARIGDVARDVGKGGVVVLNLSGRGDKDVATVAAHLGMQI